MTSTIGGEDPHHDLPGAEKDRIEQAIRKEARDKYSDKPKERNRRLRRAIEISRRKSGRAHQS